MCGGPRWLRRVCASATEQEKSKTVEMHETVASRVELRISKQPHLKKRDVANKIKLGKSGCLHTNSIARGPLWLRVEWACQQNQSNLSGDTFSIEAPQIF